MEENILIKCTSFLQKICHAQIMYVKVKQAKFFWNQVYSDSTIIFEVYESQKRAWITRKIYNFYF